MNKYEYFLLKRVGKRIENPHIKKNILKSIEREEILYKPRRMLGLK